MDVPVESQEMIMKPETYGEIHGEMRDGVNHYSPIYGRKYTMTHSDETGEMFVVIGTDYAKDHIDPKKRDEVLLEFGREGRQLAILGNVLVDGEGIPSSEAAKRYEIFLTNMPSALTAVRTADNGFFSTNPFHDQIRVLIWYRSETPEYNQFFDYGPIGDYKPADLQAEEPVAPSEPDERTGVTNQSIV